MVTHTPRQRYRYVGVGTYRPQDAANLADRALLGLTTPRGQWEPQTEPQTEPGNGVYSSSSWNASSSLP